jgi:multimeric flavodoxin WrbA
MRIAILDGDARGPGTPLDVAIEGLTTRTRARGGSCERLRLAQLAIHECVGCFDCWLKTPGLCRLRDDGRRVVEATAGADLVVFAAPMRMGFTTGLLKRATDRLIPLLLPYIQVVDGECHHTMRNGRGFDLGLLVERCDATDQELQVTEHLYRRIAKNMQGELAWMELAGASRKEELHAMDAR